MKRINYFLLLFSILLFAVEVKSQNVDSKFYVKIYGGYGILTPGSWHLAINQTVSSPSNGSTTYFSQSAGMGQGLHYGGGLGYIINEFLNVGIDAEYLSGNKISSSYSYNSYDSTSDHVSTYYTHNTNDIKYSVFSIIPNITFKALSKPSYYIYTRLGIVVAINTMFNGIANDSSHIVYKSQTINQNDVEVANNINTVYKYKTSFGMQVSVGAQFHITDNLRGLVELTGQWLPVTPATSTTSLDYYQSGGSPLYQKNITNTTYGNPIKITSSSTQSGGDGSSPSQAQINTTIATAVVEKFNINYVGLNLGFAYRF